MLPRSVQTAKDQRAYIPPHIEQAMSQQMQRNMPAHLKKYTGSDRPAYIPQHIEKQLNQQMQKNMPGHLKQYAGAYMQQRVIQPSMSPNMTKPIVNHANPGLPSRPPTPDLQRLGHSMPTGEQFTVPVNPTPQPQPPQQLQSQQPGLQQPEVTGPHPPAYDFIMNPNQPPPKKAGLPGGNSTATRALFFSGAIFLLLVGFMIVRSILSGGSNLSSFVSVAQDQQALIHLTTNAAEQDDLSVSNQNFAATAQLSLTSAQTGLVTYLQDNGQKVDVKQLSAKISTATDERLTTAAAATTYNQTFQEIMKTKLTDYISHLQQTYDQSEGETGRALLSDQYDQAQLLLTQLESATTD